MTSARTVGPAVAYLDHAATTPMRPEALTALMTHAADVGNPSSLHSVGRASRRVVEEARESVAADLGVRPGDVVFTSGGTESDNLALKGIYWQARAADPARRIVLVSAIEHHAVLDAVEWLVAEQGAELVWIPVDGDGVIEIGWLDDYLIQHREQVAVVAVMWANNETGVIQPVEAAAELCAEAGVALHIDAVQAAAWLPGPGDWLTGQTTLAVSGHKLGGPVGVGALVVNGITPQPLLHGGGQEIDVRSGTVATALIASFAAGLRAAADTRPATRAAAAELSARLVREVTVAVPQARLNAAGARRLPNISSVSFPGCQADSLLMLLDAADIACSAGSACTAGVPRPSHVLLAMGLPEQLAASALRFSVGWDSRESDVTALVAALPAVVERSLRASNGARARAVGAVQT